jgi:serine/threonine protein kinase
MQKGLNKINDPSYADSKLPKKVTKLEPLEQQQNTGGRREEEKHKSRSKPKDKAKQVLDTSFKKATMPIGQVRLEDMITLSILKGTRNTGSVKKMLHAPTLKLYAVKEIPLSNREVRIILKEWISMWQNAQGASQERVCNVYGTFWNVPEGCVSVVMEYLNAGSLENLLESAGALPEQVLLEIAINLLQSIKDTQESIGSSHGCIVPSQVLLDQTGKVKLNLGVAHKLNLHSKENNGNGSLGYYSNNNPTGSGTPALRYSLI